MRWRDGKGCHRLNRGSYAGITASAVLARMREATKTRNSEELAMWLGVSLPCLAEAGRHDVIPIAWLQAIATRAPDWNPVWILTGQGERFW